MATIFSHPAVAIGAALALGTRTIPRPLAIMGVIATILPDFDCIGFALHIPYASPFGHRGFTHSIAMALLVAALFAWRLPKEKGMEDCGPKTVFAYIFACALSHPLIDMLTNGGLGIALFWPFSAVRYFFPVNPIPVSPIGGRFFSPQGLQVFAAETYMVWLPCLTLGGAGFLLRKYLAEPPSQP